jgi:hypothetical protein
MVTDKDMGCVWQCTCESHCRSPKPQDICKPTPERDKEADHSEAHKASRDGADQGGRNGLAWFAHHLLDNHSFGFGVHINLDSTIEQQSYPILIVPVE